MWGGGAREHVPTTTPEPAVAPPPSTSGSLPPQSALHPGPPGTSGAPTPQSAPLPGNRARAPRVLPHRRAPPPGRPAPRVLPPSPPERPPPRAARVPGDEANMAAPGEARGRWLTSRRRRAGGGASRTADPGGPPRPRRRPRPPARAHAGRGRSLGPGWGPHSSPAACLPDTPARGPHRCTGRTHRPPSRLTCPALL